MLNIFYFFILQFFLDPQFNKMKKINAKATVNKILFDKKIYYYKLIIIMIQL